MIDVLRFQIFNRQTREKLDDSSFVVVHKEWSSAVKPTYTISLESQGGDVRNALLIFASGRFTVSYLIEDHVGLLVSDAPDMVFILQFCPFEYDAAVEFRENLYRHRSRNWDTMSNDELVGHVFSNKHEAYFIGTDLSYPSVLKAMFFRRELL